ncbi:YdcF family protein [Candidatus Aerophobetes bacterium]|nr:YdcF family protein [Candidatus Aerophobetes bacterium]
MLLFKLLQQLLLPGFFVWLLILAGAIFLIFLKRKNSGRLLIILGLSLYYLFSITPISDLLLYPLENKYPDLKEEDVEKSDIAVLLLGGKEADVLRASEIFRLSSLKNHKIKIIISGTHPLYPEKREALDVKKFFIERGLKEENIAIEEHSRNTWESARNIKKIVKDKPFFLVTSAYHMERAIREFEKVGTKPIPAPTDFKIKEEKYNFLDLLPDAQNLRNCGLALHEYLGILWYSLK